MPLEYNLITSQKKKRTYLVLVLNFFHLNLLFMPMGCACYFIAEEETWETETGKDFNFYLFQVLWSNICLLLSETINEFVI